MGKKPALINFFQLGEGWKLKSAKAFGQTDEDVDRSSFKRRKRGKKVSG